MGDVDHDRSIPSFDKGGWGKRERGGKGCRYFYGCLAPMFTRCIRLLGGGIVALVGSSSAGFAELHAEHGFYHFCRKKKVCARCLDMCDTVAFF